MHIGTFTKKDNGRYVGKIEIAFPNISCEAVFQPVTNKANANAPDYRILRGRAELGAAWIKQHDNVEGEYLSVKLDAPGFYAPINCALFETPEDETHRLVWERPDPEAKQ